MLNNLNAESLSFLQRNLRNVQRTRQEAAAAELPSVGVTVTVSGLAEEATEGEILQLLQDIQLQPGKAWFKQFVFCLVFIYFLYDQRKNHPFQLEMHCFYFFPRLFHQFPKATDEDQHPP